MNIENVISLTGGFAGLVGVIVSLFALNHNKIEAINEFYSNDRDERFIEARRIVHELPSKYDPADEMKKHGDKLSVLILSYEQAGILVKKRQLPFWVFMNGGCGLAVVDFYEKLTPYIEYKRKTNKLYAKSFEYLKERILSKGKLKNFRVEKGVNDERTITFP